MGKIVEIEQLSKIYGEILTNCCNAGISEGEVVDVVFHPETNGYDHCARCAECGEMATLVTEEQWENESPTEDNKLLDKVNRASNKYRDYLHEQYDHEVYDELNMSLGHLMQFRTEYRVAQYRAWKMQEILTEEGFIEEDGEE
jgi:hypothetical protein